MRQVEQRYKTRDLQPVQQTVALACRCIDEATSEFSSLCFFSCCCCCFFAFFLATSRCTLVRSLAVVVVVVVVVLLIAIATWVTRAVKQRRARRRHRRLRQRRQRQLRVVHRNSSSPTASEPCISGLQRYSTTPLLHYSTTPLLHLDVLATIAAVLLLLDTYLFFVSNK
jgi:hypothetical protein